MAFARPPPEWALAAVAMEDPKESKAKPCQRGHLMGNRSYEAEVKQRNHLTLYQEGHGSTAFARSRRNFFDDSEDTCIPVRERGYLISFALKKSRNKEWPNDP